MTVSPAKPHVLQLAPHLFAGGGRLFAAGDVHGCIDSLIAALDQANIDPSRDTVVLVGDVIDRGPDSAKCVQFLKNEFVYSTIGNHERMLIDAQTSDRWAANFIRNGGQWWLSTPESLQQDILDIVKTLPLAIEARTPRGSVGFVHAEVAQGLDWNQFKDAIHAGDEKVIQTALWGRDRINSKDSYGVEGIDRIFSGHTPTHPTRCANQYFIDSGHVFSVTDKSRTDKPLTMVNVLAHTRILVDPSIANRTTDAGAVRLIDEEDHTRGFSNFARPRHS